MEIDALPLDFKFPMITLKNDYQTEEMNIDFDLNQDQEFEYDQVDLVGFKKQIIKGKIKYIKNKLKYHNIDGYIIPKNDEFFNEYVSPENDNLKYISNFRVYGFLA